MLVKAFKFLGRPHLHFFGLLHVARLVYLKYGVGDIKVFDAVFVYGSKGAKNPFFRGIAAFNAFYPIGDALWRNFAHFFACKVGQEGIVDLGADVEKGGLLDALLREFQVVLQKLVKEHRVRRGRGGDDCRCGALALLDIVLVAVLGFLLGLEAREALVGGLAVLGVQLSETDRPQPAGFTFFV